MYHEAYTHSSGTLLTEIFALLQFFIQFTFCCIFQYQIHSGLQSQKSKGKFGSTSYIFYSFQWNLKPSIEFFFFPKKRKRKEKKVFEPYHRSSHKGAVCSDASDDFVSQLLCEADALPETVSAGF